MPRTAPEIPFDPESVLYHANGFLVVDKPAGVLAHAADQQGDDLVGTIKNWASLNPGVLDLGSGKKIHPLTLLEREASGVFIMGLSRKAVRRYREFERDVRRHCLAIVAGPLPDDGEIRGKVRSRVGRRQQWVPASLEFRKIRGDERLSLVEVMPRESRAHQIRALFSQAGRPLAGDTRFGKPAPAAKFTERFEVEGPLLHFVRVELPGEILGRASLLEAPVPESFDKVCAAKGWEGALAD